MDKVINSDKNVTPYGGLNFIYQAMRRAGIEEYLNKEMGARSMLAIYSYADVVYSLLGNALTQGSFLADLEVLKEKYSEQFFNRIPSPDTVEYVCQELKTATIIKKTPQGIEHQINYSNKLNATLAGLALKTNQLSTGSSDYTLDFDHLITENEKQDSQWTYKHTKGYQPGMAFIGRLPVYIENRNGNTPACFEQKDTLRRCFDNLDSYGIKIKNFRADSASYQREVIELAEQRCEFFYIRMMDFEDIRANCSQIKKWETVEINNDKKEVASINYQPEMCNKEYRIVVTRHKRKDGQMDLLSGSPYTYQGIITNDENTAEKGVIEFYNGRGDAENSNRYMLNDFNLHHLPFPDLSTNTVYMYLMGMCATLFEWIKKVLVENRIKGIALMMRTKAVCFHYITVAATFIKHARKSLLKIFSPEEYAVLQV